MTHVVAFNLSKNSTGGMRKYKIRVNNEDQCQNMKMKEDEKKKRTEKEDEIFAVSV